MKSIQATPDIPNWPKTLRDNVAIARYIDETSSDFVDTERIEDEYIGCVGVLIYVNPKNLKPGPVDSNVKSKKKQAAYSKLPWETRPPIIIYNDKVVDGNHRLRDALSKNEPRILAYNVFER